MHIKNVARRIGRELHRTLESSGNSYLYTWTGVDRNLPTWAVTDRVQDTRNS